MIHLPGASAWVQIQAVTAEAQAHNHLAQCSETSSQRCQPYLIPEMVAVKDQLQHLDAVFAQLSPYLLKWSQFVSYAFKCPIMVMLFPGDLLFALCFLFIGSQRLPLWKYAQNFPSNEFIHPNRSAPLMLLSRLFLELNLNSTPELPLICSPSNLAIISFV